MKKAVSSLLFLSTFFCLGCRSKQVRTPTDLAHYLEDAENGYTREIKTGSVSYHIQMATPQYMAAKETDGVDSASVRFAQRTEELEGHLFFILRMEAPKGDPAEAERMVTYYSGVAQNDMTLQYGDKVLSPASYHFEDNFSLSPYNTIVVVFATGSEPKNASLLFSDRYAGNPMIRASFDAEQLSNIPAVK